MAQWGLGVLLENTVVKHVGENYAIQVQQCDELVVAHV